MGSTQGGLGEPAVDSLNGKTMHGNGMLLTSPPGLTVAPLLRPSVFQIVFLFIREGVFVQGDLSRLWNDGTSWQAWEFPAEAQ